MMFLEDSWFSRDAHGRIFNGLIFQSKLLIHTMRKVLILNNSFTIYLLNIKTLWMNCQQLVFSRVAETWERSHRFNNASKEFLFKVGE